MATETRQEKSTEQFEEPLPPDPVIEAYKRDVDRTLLRRNLKLTVEQRLVQLMELQRFAKEVRRAGREMKPLDDHR